MSKVPKLAVYVDLGNVVSIGPVIRYWVMIDDTSGKQPPSVVTRNEVNCETMEYRRTYFASYDNQMGKGKESARDITDAPWKTAIPEDPVVLAYPICDAFIGIATEGKKAPDRK